MADSQIVIVNPETSDVADRGGSLVVRCNRLQVVDEESHLEAQTLLQGIKSVRTKVAELFAEPTQLAYRTHKSFVAAAKQLTDPLDLAKSSIVKRIVSYEEKERKDAEEEARRVAAAQKLADEEAAIASAIEAEQEGDPDAAAEILEAHEMAPEPVIQPTPRIAQVSGVSSVTRYSAEVVDMPALLAYVIEHPEHLGAIRPNQTYINTLARAQRENLRLPGVKLLKETSKSVRA